MAPATIVYFTSSFPYGIGEQWKYDELNNLLKVFPAIEIIPNTYAGNRNPVTISNTIKVNPPLESGHAINHKTALRYIFFSKYTLAFLKEFLSKAVFLNKKKLVSWYNATYYAIYLLTHPIIKQLVADKGSAKNKILLFFWGKGSCEFLPFVNTGMFKKVVVKMHRYDLFEYLDNNYIPYRKQLIQKATYVLPSHHEGLQYLSGRYPAYKDKFIVNRVGTRPSNSKVKGSPGEKLIIYSCSILNPVKRVHLAIGAAAKLSIPFEWHHIGDGPLKEQLVQLSKDLQVQDRFFFEGFILPAQLKEYYLSHAVDLFVNTSESEGIPVSLIEMLSLGVPVLATDVGSVREAVDDKVGMLMPKDIDGGALAVYVEAMYQRIKIEKTDLSGNCITRFNEIGNSDIANQELIKLLQS